MSIRIEFTCGHTTSVGDRVTASPRCDCGETQVRRAVPSRLPRFTGTCTGPLSDFQALDPGVVDVAPGGPLKLKTQETR